MHAVKLPLSLTRPLYRPTKPDQDTLNATVPERRVPDTAEDLRTATEAIYKHLGCATVEADGCGDASPSRDVLENTASHGRACASGDADPASFTPALHTGKRDRDEPSRDASGFLDGEGGLHRRPEDLAAAAPLLQSAASASAVARPRADSVGSPAQWSSVLNASVRSGTMATSLHASLAPHSSQRRFANVFESPGGCNPSYAVNIQVQSCADLGAYRSVAIQASHTRIGPVDKAAADAGPRWKVATPSKALEGGPKTGFMWEHTRSPDDFYSRNPRNIATHGVSHHCQRHRPRRLGRRVRPNHQIRLAQSVQGTRWHRTRGWC